MTKLKEIPEQQKALMRTMLGIFGTIFFMSGLALVFNPEIFTENFIDDQFIATAVACALMVIGGTDVILSRTLFKENNRK